MARIPLSFYLNIIAGIFVIFNHYASSETGDLALNKVTGAAGRFYILFQDTVTTLHRGCTSRLGTALCGPTLGGFLPYDVRLRHCRLPAQESESTNEPSTEWEPDGGFGSSDFVFVYYQSHSRPLDPRTFAEDLFGHGWSNQHHLARAVWDWSSEVMVTIGMFLLRTWASWWWFRAPLKVTGALLATYSAVSASNYLLGTNLLRSIAQVYMTAMINLIQCIQWEAQRHAWDVGVAMMERVYVIVNAHRGMFSWANH